LVWALGAGSVGLVAAQLVLTFLNLGTDLPPHAESVYFPLQVAPLTLAWVAVGALVASRRPENPIGWLFCGVGLALAVDGAAYAYGLYALYGPARVLPAGVTAAWLSSWLVGPAGFLGPLFLFVLFPDGHFRSRRWQVLTLVVVALGAVAMASGALRPDLFQENGWPGFTSPVRISGEAGRVLGNIDDAGSAFLAPAVFLLAAAALITRFRHAGRTEREQIKWVAYVAAFTGLAVPVAVATGSGPLSLFAWSLVLLGLFSIPVAAGLAILRYRLYEIDRVINRTLVYGSLTVCLALSYLGAVLLFQAVLGGLTRGSGLAVAASTLAVAALFRPARARIQGAVDRRFYRRKYDAARTLEGFSARLREEVDLEAVGGELRAVVAETMQPSHVSVWLRAP
jgi:hypothetical protein